METKFKIGDKVRIKKDLKEGKGFTIYVSKEMAKHAGEIKTIHKIIDDTTYVLDVPRNDNYLEWHFTEDMLEKCVCSLNDLQFGDVLTLRNDERYVYANGYIHGERNHYHCSGENVEAFFKKDLTRQSKTKEYDIIKVERARQTAYEREEAKEMTVEEISKALGYEVKVVK